PAGTLGRTTKPPRPNSLIALRPAGSAFFSLVFFADAKKSDRQPPQGGCRMALGYKNQRRTKKQRPTQSTSGSRPARPETSKLGWEISQKRKGAPNGRTNHRLLASPLRIRANTLGTRSRPHKIQATSRSRSRGHRGKRGSKRH